MNPQTKKIIAWHPVLTDHQAFTYQALSNQCGLPIQVQVVRLEDETRRAQGWTDTRVTNIERQVIPPHKFLRYGLRCLLENRNETHLFGSAFENPRMMLLLWIATLLRLDCYIISEPYSPAAVGYFSDHAAWRERIKNLLRPYLYRIYILTLRGGLKGIFTISRLAALQYTKAGMSTNRLFPFGYFVPSENLSKSTLEGTNIQTNQRLRLIFIGSLIARKGLHTLIAACQLATKQGINLQLDVYGPGSPTAFDFDGDRICYCGQIPFGHTQSYLPTYDLLVLPSLYDGWGVVINEALCARVPVLCSDRVGARVLVETFGAGQVFPQGNLHALAKQISELAVRRDQLQRMRSACCAAAEAIQPERAAAYMLQVLSSTPLTRAAIPSPWYRSN